jgi:aerotaxis receptor
MRNNLPVSQREYRLADGVTLVSVTDPKGRIVYCNSSFVEVSGFSASELMGQPHNIVRHPDMPAEAFRDLWTTIESGLPWTGLVKNRRKNGDHYWVRANATPMRHDGRVVGYLSVRTVPPREQIDAAEALYATLREEAAAGRHRTALARGQVVRLDLAGRLWGGVAAWPTRMGAAGTVALATPLACAAAASLWPAWPTWLACAGMAVAGMVVARRLHERTLRGLLDDALHAAGGDLTRATHVRSDGIVGDLQLAQQQLVVNVRGLVHDLRCGVRDLRGAVTEIATGNQNLSSRTEAQAASLQQTAASMEQINGTVQHSADSAQQGAELAGNAATVAQRSHEGVLAVVQAMSAISESSRRIGEILGVIEGVSFQTNILALNAAVEAARAGEQGRGFAVVAAEVRALAQRTGDAARQIKQLIDESASRVAAGQLHTTTARERMDEALRAVGTVSTLLREIGAAAGEQRLGISQVSEAVAHMDSITQQNAAMVEQLAAAAQAVTAQVKQVEDSTRLFALHPGDALVAETDAVALRAAAKQAAPG